MPKRPRASSKRDQLINTAIDLFAEQGFHATGIDTILEKSGVAKRTMYLHFRSKEELILAALRQFDGLFRNGFMRRVESAANSPKGQLLAMFDVAERWFARKKFYGCMFINAAGEYSDGDTPIRQACKDFKGMMKEYMRVLCKKAGAAHPETLAEELALLFEGAIVTAQISRKPKAAQVAKRAAQVLLDHAIPPTGVSPKNS